MAFPAGTDTRVLVVLELQLTADFYQEVGEQLQRITDGAGAPGEAAVIDLLDRCETAIEPEHRALIHPTLGVRRFVFGVGVNEEGHQGSGETSRGLDHIGRPALIDCLIEIGQVSARVLAMRLEVKVGAVCHALQFPEFARGKAEPILDVDGSLRVVGELFFRVLIEA